MSSTIPTPAASTSRVTGQPTVRYPFRVSRYAGSGDEVALAPAP